MHGDYVIFGMLKGNLTPDQLFAKNQKLAFKVVHKIQMDLPGYEQEDLMQTAQLGLWKACTTYDPERGTQFSTYAYWCIRNELLMASRSVFCKTRSAEVVSLESLTEDAPDGCSPDFYTPRTESFEDTLLGLIDAERLNLTDEEKLVLDLKKYLTESEVEKLCLVSKWQQRKIRMKARHQA